MAIDTERDELIHLPEARDKFPGGRKVALATLHRWRLPNCCSFS